MNRIEAAQARLADAGRSATEARDDGELAARHQRLKAAAAEALAGIDAILSGQG